MQLRNPISLHDELIEFFWCHASRPLRHILSQDWVAVKTCSRATYSNQSEPFAILTPRSWSNNPRFTQTKGIVTVWQMHEGTTRLRTEDIWLNPNKGENPMKESYWPSWVLEAYRPCSLHSLGLSDRAPTSAPSKKSRSGIPWMGWNCPSRGQFTWSVFLFFFCSFFSQLDFFP
jgi:hypothetical protein